MFLPASLKYLSLWAAPLLFLATLSAHAETSTTFTCASTAHAANTIALTGETLYKDAAAGEKPGYGFDLSTAPATFAGSACTGDKPFFFSVGAPDGNYRVTLVLGGPAATDTTVRAESRRLFVNQLHLPANGSQKVVFNVNLRTAPIAGSDGQSVKLKSREIGALDWDDKLTLEFNGHPGVRSIRVEPITDVPTLYLAGDSTVVDQDKEPWCAWGQMLPVFFGPGISVSNQAESGETIKSFVGERRYAKVMSTIKSGDYLMIQFAHNDQKPGSGYVPAQTEYKDLLRRYIADARAKGATPILVTPMNRRHFDDQGKIVQTLGEYPQAMRDVAAEQKVELIDLNAMSKILFEALGPEGTLHAFVHYPADTFPDQPQELKDDTHFNSYGAFELASAIVQNIKDQKLPLSKYLRPDIPKFDPAHPMPFGEWTLPASPFTSTATPYGR
jgi:lysophospholipase L1-like esterase